MSMFMMFPLRNVTKGAESQRVWCNNYVLSVGEVWNVFRVLEQKFNKPVKRPRNRWESQNNIKIFLQQVGYKIVRSIQLFQDLDHYGLLWTRYDSQKTKLLTISMRRTLL